MRSKQEGFGTLVMTLVLLFLGTLAVMSTSKVVYFEQKTATNSYKNEQALAAARAGVEKGIAYLSNITGAAPNKDSLFDRKTKRLKAAAFPITETLGTGRSTYTITMTQPDATNEPFLIQVSAKGCGDGTSCTTSATATQLVKFRQLMPNLPDDALIARKNVKLGGSTSAENSTGKGYAVLAGGTVDVKDVTGVTKGGLGKLSDISADDFFKWFFGDTKANVKSMVPTLNSTFPPTDTGGLYWIDGDTAIHANGTYGSPEDPVVLIVNGDLQLNGNLTIYGVLYVVGGSGGAGWTNSGGGNAKVYGAAISEASATSTGNLDISKDQDVLNNISATTKAAKVLASWRDF